MRTTWKLAALAIAAIVVGVLFLAPLATIQVTVDLPPATTTAEPDAVDQAATWILGGLAPALALIALGVLAWVARHILRRSREPGA